MPHKKLLKKMKAHGITGNVLRWVRSWLSDRRQKVVLNGKFSTWAEVLSGVPHGSVLGPLLFVVFINDIDGAVRQVDIIRKFADDTKIGRKMVTVKDKERPDAALDTLNAWASPWGMEFNIPKYKVMHLGDNNPRHEFVMGGQKLATTAEERDKGVAIIENLKPAAQCAKATKTAQTVLGQICRASHYRDRHIFFRLYKQYVRLHLEFSTQARSPWTEADKEILERVQKRAVKMVTGLRETEYKERLKEMGLLTLEERRHQADMHMVHKMLHAESGMDPEHWFEKASAGEQVTRRAADPFNIKPKYGRLELRRNFFSVRVEEDWNKIPAEVKSHSEAARFKRAYRKIRARTTHPAS